jgi:hypothetical protein
VNISAQRPQQAARLYLQLLANVGSVLLGAAISILLGFSPLPTNSPLFDFLQGNAASAFVVGALVLLMAIGALWISRRVVSGKGMLRTTSAQVNQFIVSTLIATIGSIALGLLLGLNTLPSSVPFLNLIRTHPPLALGLIGIPLAFMILSPIFAFGPQPQGPSGDQRDRRLYTATAVSLASSLLFVSLLSVVIVRPPWCPTAICPAPIVVTNPDGAHDDNLEVFYTATQSAIYSIPGAPEQYDLDHLPDTVGARMIGSEASPYRAVIGVHSIQRNTRFGLIIDQVAIHLESVAPVPDPFNIWVKGAPLDYRSNPYLATPRGETSGQNVIAKPTQPPYVGTQLKPGESDEIDVEVRPVTAVRLTFRVLVTYRVSDQTELHTLTVPHLFALDTSTSENWHLYQLQDGQLRPAP